MTIAGRKFLLVEDEPVIGFALEDMMIAEGAETRFASSLDEGLSLAEANTFDAAVLDVNLHGRNSYPLARRLLARLVGTEPGLRVVGIATDGEHARRLIAETRPDLVFLDIMMPRLDGYETCSLIKHNKVYRDTPVIMLSSKDGLFDRARGRIVGSEQYLTKPFTKDELLGAISNQIN